MAKRFLLDTKALMPRMSRYGARVHPDRRAWKEIKGSVLGQRAIDWNLVRKNFQLSQMWCPETDRPLSVREHRILKGMYAFLQAGYVIRDGDRIGVFLRPGARNRITAGCSTIFSVSPEEFGAHESALAKICSLINHPLEIENVAPFAAGFSELEFDPRHPNPAYFWILYDVRCENLPLRSQGAPGGKDSFAGMRRVSNLRSGRTRLGGAPVRIDGSFDQLLLDFLHSGVVSMHRQNAAVRLLEADEKKTMPSWVLKKRREYPDRRGRSLTEAGVRGARKAWRITAGMATMSLVADKFHLGIDWSSYLAELAEVVSKLLE